MPLQIGPRQYQADFQTAGAVLSEVSLIRRPDAISYPYLTAFSVGPDTVGDATLGVLRRVWRIRDDGAGNIMLARANDTNDAWETETLLFSYTEFDTSPILELDFAFEQAARPVVCAERKDMFDTSFIWIYWFDPTLSDFSFEMFGQGRTPRCVLDNPQDIANSDVLVFYLQDGGPT